MWVEDVGSCSKNMTQVINSYNGKVKQTKKKRAYCVTADKRMAVQWTVNAVQWTQSINALHQYQQYIGLSEDKWKKRYYNRKKSFGNQLHLSETMLTSYMWETKRAIEQIPSLKWSIITTLPVHSNITKRWQLSLYEKYAIITYPDPENLSKKRSKITPKCSHQRTFSLSNYDTHDWNPDLINFINC